MELILLNSNSHNNLYKVIENNKIEYDLWLDNYKDILEQSKNMEIIDLCCGFGGNSLYLKENNYKVISCDFSKESLKFVETKVKPFAIKELKINNKLPFKDNIYKVIIADLSNQTFNNNFLMKIIIQIKDILVKGGFLIIRIRKNSDEYKKYFKGFEVISSVERTIYTQGIENIVQELCLKNKKMELNEEFLNLLAKYSDENKSIENIYYGKNENSKVYLNNLDKYLEMMKEKNPSILIIGESQSYNSGIKNGLPFNEEDNKIIKEKYANTLRWNIFPFYPYEESKVTAKRSLKTLECTVGISILVSLLKLFPSINKIVPFNKEAYDIIIKYSDILEVSIEEFK